MGKITSEMTPEPDRTERLQQDIRRTEGEITETLHEIEENLSPSHIKEKVKKRALDYSVHALVVTMYKINRHPVRTAFIGAGTVSLIVWQIVRRRRGRPAGISAGARLLQSSLTEFREHPVKTARRVITIGRAVATIGSVIGAVLVRKARPTSPQAVPSTYKKHQAP